MPGSKKSLYDVSLKDKLVNTKKSQALFDIKGGDELRICKYIGTVTVRYNNSTCNSRNKSQRKNSHSKTKRKNSRSKNKHTPSRSSRKKIYEKKKRKNIDTRYEIKQRILLENMYNIP